MADILKKITVIDDSATAGADIPRYRAVKLNVDGLAVLAGDGEAPDGFVTRDFAEGERVEMITDGVVPAQIGTAAGVTKGVLLAVGADGKLDTGTTGDPVGAVSRGEANANDDVISVRVSDLLRLNTI